MQYGDTTHYFYFEPDGLEAEFCFQENTLKQLVDRPVTAKDAHFEQTADRVRTMLRVAVPAKDVSVQV